MMSFGERLKSKVNPNVASGNKISFLSFTTLSYNVHTPSLQAQVYPLFSCFLSSSPPIRFSCLILKNPKHLGRENFPEK